MSKNVRSLLLVITHGILGLGIAVGFTFKDLGISGLSFGLMVGVLHVTWLNKEKP